ncbi:PocR ligand-binding domain-containing protein [Horticoccus sp. 23ND18S-11]|uniref:PocR ligand-binding domain-containing protein n=1 Tax=Horticoccus sp. 23ND18S-11 TaxID=3391832 RepID=UPI0039C9A27D
MIRLEPQVPPLPGAAAEEPTHHARRLIETLRQSPLFHDFQQAFETTTGLPLTLQPPDALDLAHQHSKNQSPFCVLMAGHNKSCSACLEIQRLARESATTAPVTLTCHAGLCESSVAIRNGDSVIGYLQVGQVFLRPPTAPQFARTLRRLSEWNPALDRTAARAAYFRTRVMSRKQYLATLELLEIFARHLALHSNVLMLNRQVPDSPTIARTKRYITEHLDEPLTLVRAARLANMSSCYFCKKFRRATGLNFIEYVGRARVERVKQLLLNRQMRISEGAYTAGFTSLSQFNRTFKRFVGEEPRTWREKQLN